MEYIRAFNDTMLGPIAQKTRTDKTSALQSLKEFGRQLGVRRGRLALGGIELGMPLEAVEAELGQELTVETFQDDTGLCSGEIADTPSSLRGPLQLTFDSRAPDRPLLSIFVPITNASLVREVIETIAESIPDLTLYEPSRRDVFEGREVANPLFVLEASPQQAILVSPGEGVWITLTRCID
jgi:hypothetical protein